MSRTAVEQVIGRLVLDPTFRTALSSDAKATLAEYDLTSEEQAGLSEVQTEAFGDALGHLDERLSKSMHWQ